MSPLHSPSSAPSARSRHEPPPVAVAAPSVATDVLRDEHFRKLARDIESRVGIKLPHAKKTMVEGRLRRRARALGIASLNAYGSHLFDRGQWEQEFSAVVDCVTTNKTDFFREPEHFEILRALVLPALVAAKSIRAGQGLKLWSAACSTGAEAYTLAMLLAAVQTRHDFGFSILGTDINSEVLETARRGVYAEDMGDPIPPDMRRTFTMEAIDERRKEFRIVPELRRHVKFSPLNLMQDTFNIERDFHVVFCRNVLIYFEKDVQRAVVGRLVRHLRPGGFLFLGHSEATAGGDQPALRQVAPTVFQREG